MKFTPMMFDGTHYIGKPRVSTNSPYEGDSVLSPSTKLVDQPVRQRDGQLGYVLRKRRRDADAARRTRLDAGDRALLHQGAKPAFSFDENYFVIHHYVGPNDCAELGFSSANDPAFQPMLDEGHGEHLHRQLATGAGPAITNMKPGQYALFPHFRSDGWIYFLVRDKNTNKEYAVASDAALSY